jgi:hypothetical protein
MGLLLAACSPPAPPEPAEIARFVHDRLPDGLGRRTRLDFEGKIALVYHEVNPAVVEDHVALVLYWQSLAPIEPGYRLVTSIHDEYGKVLTTEAQGPLRSPEAFAPDRWVPGKVYQDPQQVRLPPGVTARELSVRVSVARDAEATRLRVVSGVTDGRDRGVIAHLTMPAPARTAPQLHPKLLRGDRMPRPPAPTP